MPVTIPRTKIFKKATCLIAMKTMYLLGCLSIVFHELASFVADIALRYLNLVNDYQQYPAARCAMGDNVVMYQLYKGAARKKRAYDGGDGAVAVTKEDVVDVVRKTYKGAARKKRADDAGDGAVAFRRSNRAK